MAHHGAASRVAPHVDLAALRAYRLERVQLQLRANDCAAALLYNPINIRYATDSRNMTVWMLHNMGRYCVVPAVGRAVLFEYANRNCIANVRDLPAIAEVRPATDPRVLRCRRARRGNSPDAGPRKSVSWCGR